MEMECPKCGYENQLEDPKGDGIYFVAICDECGCYYDEDGTVFTTGESIKGEK